MAIFDEDNLAYNDDAQEWEDVTDEAYDSEACEDWDEYENIEDWDGLTDAEADADTLASAGFVTDEDYGCFDEDYDW